MSVLSRKRAAEAEAEAMLVAAGAAAAIVLRRRKGDRTYGAPEEAAEIFRFSGRGRTRAFYRCWVLKEAYLKAVGIGLAGGLDSFAVGITGSPTLRRGA